MQEQWKLDIGEMTLWNLGKTLWLKLDSVLTSIKTTDIIFLCLLNVSDSYNILFNQVPQIHIFILQYFGGGVHVCICVGDGDGKVFCQDNILEKLNV